MYARIRYLWICLILITILTGCAEPSSAASTSIATVSRPESSSPTDTPSPSAAAIVWPEEDYAALGEEGKAAYREALAEQLPADGYLILEDGFVVENDSAGRYAPADFAALLPDVTLPAQAVGGYALNEIQVSWQPDPLARPGDRVFAALPARGRQPAGRGAHRSDGVDGFHPLIKTGGPRHKRREPPVHFYILSLFLSHCSQSSCQRWVR